MNQLTGIIKAVRVQGHLSLVEIAIGEVAFKSIVIETPETAPHLQPGKTIKVLFKETEVIIGIGQDIPVSLRNRLEGTIRHMEQGQLLSKITIDHPAGTVVSVITSNAVEQLQLKPGSLVTAMIKTNEIMLSE